MRLLTAALTGAAMMIGATAHAVADDTPKFDAGLLGQPEISFPTVDVTGVIFLLSDGDGWGDNERKVAAALVGDGAIVVGIDTPSLLARMEKEEDDCVYGVSDIEGLSGQLQRAGKTQRYFSPIVAGAGPAGALALGIAAQTPDATIGRTVVVDPEAVVKLKKPLCTDAPQQTVDGGIIYGLQTGPLPDEISVYYTPDADKPGRDHVAELVAEGYAIVTHESADDRNETLRAKLDHILKQPPKAKTISDLPIVELPATAKYDTLAVVYSGDGGWRDIDKSIAETLQSRGVPTIGVDSLRYFWANKDPADVADDLSLIMDTYTAKWNVKQVLLIGYSFGADTLPATFNGLDDADKARVRQISLLGFSDNAIFQISVEGWLGIDSGGSPTVPEVKRIDPKLIQCFYGSDEDDSACPEIGKLGVELVKTEGGHHFDGDYDALADKILNGLTRRTAAGPAVERAAAISKRTL